MTTVKVPLSQGYVAIVDAADADRVLAFNWSAVVKGRNVYALRNVREAYGKRTTQSLHQFLTGYRRTGHRNGNGLDNRRSNLRDDTAGSGRQNWRRSDNKSGFKGVYWDKARREWRAQISVGGGKRKYLGSHATAEEAAQAYDDAARELHGEFAALNFPQPGEHAA